MAENPDWDYRQAEKQAFIDAALQVGEASFGGWLTGSFMGGGYSGIQTVVDNVQKNQQAYNLYGQVQQELVTEALELNPNNAYAQKLQDKLDSNKQLSGAELRKLAAQNETAIQNDNMQTPLTSQIDKVSQKPTARNVGQLNATVQAANIQVNQAAVAESLKGKGIPSWKIDTLAEAIVRRAYDQKLTRTQSEILSFEQGRPSVQNIISDLIQKKAKGIDSTLKNAYDEINTIGGNKNGQEATLWHLSNQRADGSLQSLQTQTRAEDGNGSGVPGTLREIGGLPAEALSATQRRGLTSETDAFGDNEYATGMQGSSLHQVQKAFSKRIYESSTDVLDGNKRTGEIVVEFNYNSKYDKIEFARQLADQQRV